MKKIFQRFSEISAVVFIFGLLAAIIMFINLVTPVSFKENWKEVRIPEGSTYSKAISILQGEGIINDRFVLILLGRITMKDRRIRPGYYNLSSSMTPLEIFDQLINGKAIHFTITIPEGDTLEDIRAKLSELKLIDYESWKLTRDSIFLKSLDINAPSLEGYLFPDTYIFAKGTEPATILKTMVQRLRENFDPSMTKRIAELGMCENDVLTLASIIEKEAYLDEERAVISAVYHNRLKKSMRLQADPTAIYGVHTCLSCITRADLRRKTPYNTYVIDGLPPGPIACPGLKSIKAALNPAKVNYLYFVAKNDGSHYFSRTNAEHSQAVLIYRHSNENNSTRNDQETTDQTDNTRAN
ncbi:MAG: endolytic transglycosylase MltG [Nitrospirae bacterium]|nr:endolytic transglycosylase MltG [Nitrospirota bacterium]